MAKHGIRANRRKEAPRATIQAAPTVYETTKPVGSAERFLDDAAKEALASAAAAAMPAPNLGRFVPGAVRETAIRYPDPLLAEAARLPEKALAESAARAEAYRRAMDAQNEVVRVASAVMSPVGNMAVNQAGATAHDALTRQDAKGGETPGTETAVSETPVSETPVQQGGPRIVINPTTFRNRKDALCVAFNEGFRLWMEATGFEPQSEPTDAQRKFFSDTAYADDEVQLRRTILARIATFDTSVKDPTDDQLSETASFLGAILESDWCKNDWERDSVSRLMNAVQSAVGAEPATPSVGVSKRTYTPESQARQNHAAIGGGETDDEKNRELNTQENSSDWDWDMKNMEAISKLADNWNKTTDQILARGEKLLAGVDDDDDDGQPAPTGTASDGQPAPTGTASDGQGIAAPKQKPGVSTASFRKSTLSMNGPAIKPSRAIGDTGGRALTNVRGMNRSSIQPTRAIGGLKPLPETSESLQEQYQMKKRKRGVLR